MICAWKELLSILPAWLRLEVDKQGREDLQELRLRILAPPELVCGGRSVWLHRDVVAEDLNFVINTASRYSPWAAETLRQGYITAPGGHRIGICGSAVCRGREVTGIRDIRSVCIRIARDFPDISVAAAYLPGSILILGAPGWGKTTLLRDLCRQIAQRETVAVVDERGELFPDGFPVGNRLDILTGSPKAAGIDMVLRTMGPSCIGVDEITAQEDTEALLQAANCGARLLSTAHASSMQEFRSRGIYQPLITNRIFQNILILRPDKSYTAERMTS